MIPFACWQQWRSPVMWAGGSIPAAGTGTLAVAGLAARASIAVEKPRLSQAKQKPSPFIYWRCSSPWTFAVLPYLLGLFYFATAGIRVAAALSRPEPPATP